MGSAVTRSRLIPQLSVYAAGTIYNLTATAALIDFGTTDPSLTITGAGSWLLLGRAFIRLYGAVWAGNESCTLKLRRTNNTAADITSATTTAKLETITDSIGPLMIPPVVYTTAFTDDVISLFGSVSTLPISGTVDVIEASIMALKLTT